MERTIFGFILAYSKRQQIVLMLVTLASFPFLYYSLDLPKIIINDAINGGEQSRIYFETTFNQLEYLFLLCTAFLILVLLNGSFKYFINVYRGRLAEIMLRRIRYILYSRVLRFPLPNFSKLSQGEIVSIITAEAEPLGGFFGESFSLPLYQGGILVTILGFIAIQDIYMGLAAIALYPLQMWLIPKLQSHVNQLAKRRVLNVRKVSERISETVNGVHEVHVNDTSQYELAGITDLLGRNFAIRLQIYKRKFFIKFLNNFIAQVTPFFFYSIGGYLVIKGDLSFGALVASLAAYKDLASPWKELLTWYQRKEDSRIKYDQLVERFHPDGILDENLQTDEPGHLSDVFNNDLTTTNLSWQDEGGVKSVDGVSLHIKPHENIFIMGSGGSGKEKLAQMLARLLPPTTGSIRLGEQNIALLPESVTGRKIAYTNSEAFMFNGTIKDNLLYGLNHRPSTTKTHNTKPDQARADILKDAQQAGNSGYDIQADWIDYTAAGLDGPAHLTERILEVLNIVNLEEDIYAMGLRHRIDPTQNQKLCESILKLRGNLSNSLKQPEYSDLVEQFNEELYNENATVAENLLFGTPVGEKLALHQLADNPYVLKTLKAHNLVQKFTEMGVQAATAMVDLFKTLPPGHEFFERFGFMNSDDLPEYRSILDRVTRSGIDGISDKDTSKLIEIPFSLTISRHRLGIVDKDVQSSILAARKTFRENLPKDLKDSIEFFDALGYNRASTIQNNILFGHMSYNKKDAESYIGTLIRKAVENLGVYEDILITGLGLPTGIGGKRITLAQRQKISLARCLLKRPDLLIMDENLSALDVYEKTLLTQNVLSEITDGTVIYFDGEETLSTLFDRTLYMKNGRLTEKFVKIDEQAPEQAVEKIETIESLAGEVRALSNIPMFAALDPSNLKLLAFTSRRITFEPGQEICHQGEAGDTAYIILEGKGEIFIDTQEGETLIREVHANDIIGEISLITDVPRTATVRVTKHTVALELAKNQFLLLLEQDNKMSIEVLKQMSYRLKETTDKISTWSAG